MQQLFRLGAVVEGRNAAVRVEQKASGLRKRSEEDPAVMRKYSRDLGKKTNGLHDFCICYNLGIFLYASG